MAKEGGLPPKTGKGRMGPEMMDEDPAIVSKLSQLAGAGQEAPMGGGGGGEEQSASLLMQGAQQLIQAAQMNPQLQQMVTQVIGILREGVQGLAGGPPGGQMGGQEGGGMGRGGGGGRKRMRPPKVEREQPAEEMGY